MARRKPTSLTDLQQRFVDEYLKDLNATAAYARAGYKARGNAAESAAARLLRNVQVKRAVDAAMAARAERVKVDQDWVMERLIENVDKARQAVEVVIHGKPTGEYIFQGQVVNKALELIGKHIGMFIEKREIVMTGPPFKLYKEADGFNPNTA